MRIVWLLLCAAPSSAQWLHDAARAKSAEQAVQLARGIAAGGVFDKQLENMNRLSRLSSDRVFEGAELAMRRNLLMLRRWEDLAALLDETGEPQAVAAPTLEADLAAVRAKSAEAKARLAALKTELAARIESPNAVLAGLWLKRLGNLDEVDRAVSALGVGGSPSLAHRTAAAELSSTFESLALLFENTRKSLPPSLDLLTARLQIDLLAAEEVHLRQLGLIGARREMETGDMQSIAKLARNQLAKVPVDWRQLDVRAALALGVKAGAHEHLENATSLLLNASALAARSDTAERLALLRQAEEAHRHSIRASAAAVNNFEQLLLNGAERLSLYYQGGVKPENLVRLMNALATLGLIPAVMAR